jgi:hypothetical protein
MLRWMCLLALVGCSEPGAQLVFDLDAPLTTAKTFYDAPFPSDLRVAADGRPIVDGWPTNANTIMEGLLESAKERKGFPLMPVAYFQFTKPIAARQLETVIAAQKTSPIFLVDIDSDSPERGRIYPTVAKTLADDDYVPANLLAVAARPGFVLAPERTYAFVIMRAANDAAGAPLDVAPAIADLARGSTPAGARGAKAAEQYAPLFATLSTLGVEASEVAAATVFTTGDVVKESYELSTGLMAKHQAVISDLAIDPDDGARHPRFCELDGKMKVPQFQKGTPPFSFDGRFVFGSDQLPIAQRDETIPIKINLPKTPMPAAGYPLAVYFHGSGGLSSQVVDRGKREMGQTEPKKGEGPAHVLAEHGFATVGSAHPVNPERVANATETEYLNFNNLAAFRDTFRQGIIEQRMFMEALRTLEIPPSVVAACNLPAAAAYKFDPNGLTALGQSMGGMYTNLIGAIEPRVRAVVPTGAGGLWNLFITKTTLITGLPQLLAALLMTDPSEVTFVHPGMYLFEVASEPAEPGVYMPRLAHRPLSGHPTRPVYEPVGKGDSYFPIELYDAIALAYDHQQAGQIIWPSMQDALALDGRSGILPYPVMQNRTSLSGSKFTGVVVQYEGDGFSDPHSIYAQLDAVKFQYGCFLKTFMATGIAVVPAPAALGTPCPMP